MIAAWTDGAFNVYALAPASGDAPGSDPDSAPRPPNAVRVLTAVGEGTPYAIRIYDSTSSQAQVMASYDAQMPDRGWQRVIGETGEDKEQRAFSREGGDLMIFTSVEESGTFVTLVESRAR